MFEGVFTDGGQGLLTYGPLGIAVVGLVWYIVRLQNDAKDREIAHKAEIAAERKLNAELQGQRLADMKEHIEHTHAWRAVMEATLSAVKEKSS